MADISPLAQVLQRRIASDTGTTVKQVTVEVYYGDMDGGASDSNYGGIDAIDAGKSEDN